jgi:hypothetical protein
MRIRFRLASLWHDIRANALMFTALALPFVVGAAGLGVHTVHMTLAKGQLQRMADSAALAGAYSLFQGKDNTAATASANTSLSQNNLITRSATTITPGSYTVNSTTYTQQVYVSLSTIVPTPFMSMWGRRTTTVTSEARAATVPEGSYCFLALEDTTTTGVTFAGNSSTNLGCGVGTNSTNTTQAIRVNGSPTVTASPLVAMGTVENSAAYTSGTVIMSNHAQLTNPFGSTNYDPAINNGADKVNNVQCKSGNTWNSISVASNTTLDMSATTGGCYTTIDVQGTLTLGDGIYYIVGSGNNSGLKVGAQGHLTCAHCAFVLTTTTDPSSNQFSNNVAQVSINGGAELDLGAPTSGTYSGISVYRDSRVTSNSQFNINGNSNSTLSGAWYFPKDTLNFNGTAGMQVTCFQMVAHNLSFSGDASMTNSCTPPGGSNAWALSQVRLSA